MNDTEKADVGYVHTGEIVLMIAADVYTIFIHLALRQLRENMTVVECVITMCVNIPTSIRQNYIMHFII